MLAEIKKEIEAEGLWSGVFGAIYGTGYWLRKIKFLGNADWDVMGQVEISIMDPEYDDAEKVVTKTIGIEELVEALVKTMELGYHHCGYRIDEDFDSYDSCVADVVLQVAVFGKLIYA